MTKPSIGKLFLSGIIPGIIFTLLFTMTIAFMVRRNPKLAPPAERQQWDERRRSLWRAAPLMVIVIIVLGGIYTGWFTPVEAASIGAIPPY